MIIHQMLLVPWILLHALVVLHALEKNLAEAIEVGDVAHLRVEQLGHQGARGALVVNLFCNHHYSSRLASRTVHS